MDQKQQFQDMVRLPLAPALGDAQDMAIYARFMRHVRCVPNSRMEIKVLAALQFTADMQNCSDAHVSKLLVELGLRASRAAFPADFLRYADQALLRSGWDVGGPSTALWALKAFWDDVGEDKFAAFQGDYALLDAEAVV